MELELIKTDIMPSSEYHQFYLGILMRNEHYIKEVYNRQIDIMYDKSTGVLTVPFENSYNWYTDTCLRIEGFILGKSWDLVDNGLPNHLPELFRKKLDAGYYIKYTGDLFYIGEKLEYDETHTWSDIYITGYEQNQFIAVGKTKSSFFDRYIISGDEIIDSAIKRENIDIYSKYTYSFELDFYKLKSDLSFDISMSKIKSQIYNYLNPIKREKYILGIDVYQAVMSDWKRHGVILQQLYYIRDYINLMWRRIVYLSRIFNIPKLIINSYATICKKIEDFSNNIPQNKELDTYIKSFDNVIQEEINILSDLLSIL